MSVTEEIAGLIRTLRGQLSHKEQKAAIDALEAKVGELERKLSAVQPTGQRCPYCGFMTMMLDRQEKCRIGGDLGAYDFHWKCSNSACGRTHISNGFDARL